MQEQYLQTSSPDYYYCDVLMDKLDIFPTSVVTTQYSDIAQRSASPKYGELVQEQNSRCMQIFSHKEYFSNLQLSFSNPETGCKNN